MDRVAKFQDRFLKYIQGDESSGEVLDGIPCGSLSLKESLEIYRNNFYQNLKEMLENMYPATCKLITNDVFDKLAMGFIGRNPLKSRDMLEYGASFPEFLKNSKMQATFPFLYQLACLERLIEEIFSENCDNHCKQMKINHPVHQIWNSLLHEEERIVEIKKESTLLVFRHGEIVDFKVT